MYKTNPGYYNNRIDARMVSLYSQGTDNLTFPDLSSYKYKSFMYYQAINVDQVKVEGNQSERDNSPLLAAYQDAVSKLCKKHDAFQQIILAFTDMGPGYYSHKEILDFWNDDQPIIFISMINLTNVKAFDIVREQIRDIFPSKKYLMYYTFDNSDLIIFYKSDRFTDYPGYMYRLCFNNDEKSTVIADCMTLYGFNFQAKKLCAMDDRFDVMLSFGVDNYGKIKDYYDQHADIDIAYLLGRNDSSIYFRNVNMQWLGKVFEEIPKESTGILHNVDIILLTKNKLGFMGKTASRSRQKETEVIPNVKKLLQHFIDQYKRIYDKEQLLQADEIFLRWLRESCELACALYNNVLSSDIAACLLPQYVNLITYFIHHLKRCEELSQGNSSIFVRLDERMNHCFTMFFNNILTLMDSMNHSDRQFVQAPSFHSPSFEMPPKLLAYYTAATAFLVQAFQDDPEYYHGFILSPRFAQELDVRSLTVLANGTDNMLSIGIGESRIYTISHTTQALSHEIAHFIGQGVRCRKERKACILKYCIRELLIALVSKFLPEEEYNEKDNEILSLDELNQLAIEEEFRRNKLEVHKLGQLVDVVYGKLLERAPEYYGPNSLCYMQEIEKKVLPYLPEEIRRFPDIAELIIDWVTETFFEQVLINGVVEARYEKKWQERIDSMIGDELNLMLRQSILREELRNWFYGRMQVLSQYFVEKVSQADTEELARGKFICYMFSETFADLQTILLFKLDWTDYENLLNYRNALPPRDIYPRMLAVAKAMLGPGDFSWNSQDIQAACTKNDNMQVISKTILLEPLENSAVYGLQKINAELIYYLMIYLQKCKQEIWQFLDKSNHKSTIERLRTFHNLVNGNDLTACEVEKQIMGFVSVFEESFESSLKTYASNISSSVSDEE